MEEVTTCNPCPISFVGQSSLRVFNCLGASLGSLTRKTALKTMLTHAVDEQRLVIETYPLHTVQDVEVCGSSSIGEITNTKGFECA